MDLDQGGRIPQSHRTYLGPSVGWKLTDEPTDIEWVINGVGATISPGLKGTLLIPEWVIVNDWIVLTDLAGSIQFDVYKVSLTQYLAGTIPGPGNSICGTDKPILVSQTSNTSSLLTGWTKQINQNDVLAFNVDSVAMLVRVTLILRCVRIIGLS